ncbi:hypothetical protein BG015_009778 [Linnemannia schmuckeri]|uniref:F-box domain-containing protein n=1 Tax=Linnemannia schmuckeri TaxID=64567 RepID=A0A9P5RV00_9FUNG|nr:hypothetical protein BG015_009778 [Linnemannia schmuckeri]
MSPRRPASKLKRRSKKIKNPPSTTADDNNATYNPSTTTITSGAIQRIAASLSDLPCELLFQISSYISRKDIHSCTHVSKSLSESFAPYLWQAVDISLCYPRRGWLTHLRRFNRFKAFAIDTKTFSTNGQFIQSLKGVYVNWLVSFPPPACANLRELDVAGYVYSPEKRPNPVKANTISTLSKTLGLFLRCQLKPGMLRKLTVGGGILCSETDADQVSLMKSIPDSVKELKFRRWWGRQDAQLLDQMEKGTWKPDLVDQTDINSFVDKYQEMKRAATRDLPPTPALMSTSTNSGSSHDLTGASVGLDRLPNLKKLTFDHSCIDQPAISRLVPWFPVLETLTLFDSNIVQPLASSKTLLVHCLQLSALCISRTQKEHYRKSTSLTCFLLLCTSVRGWNTIILRFLEDNLWLDLSAQWALREHAGTLEALFLQGCDTFGAYIDEMLCSSPRLKRIVVNLDDEGWPYTDPMFPGNVPDVTEGLELQRELYRRLGRLTKLKELIVGFIEDDEFSSLFWPTLYDDPSISLATSGGRQPSHATNLENGLDLLKDLKQLRRVELPDLKARGFMKFEKDLVWTKTHWPLWDNSYRGDFWDKFTHLHN